MIFTTEKIQDILNVTLEETSFDAKVSDDFKKDITDVLEGNTKVIFDLGKVEFMDSSGCGAILSCLRKLSIKDGDLKLYAATKSVRTLLELVRMHRVIEILNTREEALQSF
jgi:anti-sigma B factor antagonist